MTEKSDPRAPMASAPFQYNPDGSVDWGTMWHGYCVLALDGGPPHRDSMLYAEENANPASAAYQKASSEIIRGIGEVCGLSARPATPGWIAVDCPSTSMAGWLAAAMVEENVQARAEGATLYVPTGESFTLKGEVKNVITAVGKTTHYWGDHLPPAVKQTLVWQERLQHWGQQLRRWLRRPQAQ